MRKLIADKKGIETEKLIKYIIVFAVVGIVFFTLGKIYLNKYWSYLPGFQSSDKRTELPEISDELWEDSVNKPCTLIGWIDSNGGNYIYELYFDGKELRNFIVKDGVIYFYGTPVGNTGGNQIEINAVNLELYGNPTKKEIKYLSEINGAQILEGFFLCGEDAGEDLPVENEKPIVERPVVVAPQKDTCSSLGGECEWWSCSDGEVSKGRVDCNYGFSCCVKNLDVNMENNVVSYSTTTNLKSFRKLSKEELDSYLLSKPKTKERDPSELIKYSDVIIKSAKDNNIDPYYVFSHFVHETGWGTSRIWNVKNNPFGIGAYDKSPFEKAYSFDSKEEGIQQGVKWIRERYLCEKGESDRCKHPSDNLNEMNIYYATDKLWASKITNTMNGLNSYVLKNYPKDSEVTA